MGKTIHSFELPSNRESYAKVRKHPVRAGQPHKDKRNDYQRKPKHAGRGWESSED